MAIGGLNLNGLMNISDVKNHYDVWRDAVANDFTQPHAYLSVAAAGGAGDCHLSVMEREMYL